MTGKLIDTSASARPLGTIDSGVMARIAPWGDIDFADGSPTLRWFVAADDRWHDPSAEVAVRQRCIGGAPVYETRLRVPGGDVIQRVYCSVGPHGRPVLVVELENDSRLAVVVALSRRDLAVSRPVAVRGSGGEWPAPGLDLPEAPTVIPVGHQTTVRVAIDRSTTISEPTAFPDGIADLDAVVRGWSLLADKASAISVPDVLDSLPVTERLVIERSSVVLEPPSDTFVGSDPTDAANWLLDAREAVRMGVRTFESSEVATATEVILRACRRADGVFDARSAAAMRAAAELLHPDQRAVRDLARAVTGKRGGSLYSALGGVRLGVSASLTRGAFVAALEESLALPAGENSVNLLPDGCPIDRLGSGFEAHGLRIGDRRVMSFAVRWHGSNAAVLWEVTGETAADGVPEIELLSGADAGWSARSASGEGLLRIDAPITETSITGMSFS